jgi:UDP-N-acetylglucosamine 4,6-dehydratase
MNLTEINNLFDEKILLITGGTGSFGRTVVEALINSKLKEIRIFSRDEKKQEEMRIQLNNPKVKFYIGDVRDYGSVFDGMKNVDFVFHAAALKQVPSCEFYPLEAYNTNVIGSENVINAGVQRGVKKIVFLSTDKAVYPVNAMGISKAMMEKLVIAKSRMLEGNETTLCATRYGNVMGSRGSVIPLFIEQLKNNEQLTITDPKMTRFLMGLDDSVDLVLHAFKNGNQGDIFVQKSAASTLDDLAKTLMKIFNQNCPLKVIGTRHGEKLYETLVSREEMVRAQDMGNYFRITADNRDLNYNEYFTSGAESISESEDYTSHNAQRLSIEEISDLLFKKNIVDNVL